jgi:hypothetical protein
VNRFLTQSAEILRHSVSAGYDASDTATVIATVPCRLRLTRLVEQQAGDRRRLFSEGVCYVTESTDVHSRDELRIDGGVWEITGVREMIRTHHLEIQVRRVV